MILAIDNSFINLQISVNCSILNKWFNFNHVFFYFNNVLNGFKQQQ